MTCKLELSIPKSTNFCPLSKITPHWPPLCFCPFVPLHLSRPAPCIIHLICAEEADPSLPQHASIDPQAPECLCYFKMLRPVISVLMIVIAKATSSVWLFQACGYQQEAGSLKTHTNTHACEQIHM